MTSKKVAYILNAAIPVDKVLSFGLLKVYGIGHSTSRYICDRLGISATARVNQLPDWKIQELENFVKNNFVISKELKRTVMMDVQRKIESGSYVGSRLAEGYPVRGQRTHTNARTAKKLKRSYGQ